MKNECLWRVDIEFKILMRRVKSLLKQTTPLQICSAPFLNSPEQADELGACVFRISVTYWAQEYKYINPLNLNNQSVGAIG